MGAPDAVREVLRRADDFVPTNALTCVVPLAPAALRVLSRARFALPPVLASATGEQHRRVRQVVTAFFTPRTVAAVQPRLVALTQQHSARARAALDDGPVDLAAVVAHPVPPTVMDELTGIGCPDLPVLKRWSRHSLELFWGWPDADRQLVLAASAAELYEWLREQVRAARGTDGLFGALHDTGLSEAEVCSLGYFLVIAAQETTAQLAATALHRAVRDPSTWQALADGASAQPLVRRVLAQESSVPTWRRVAAHDTQLGGVHLPAGAEVLLELTGHHGADAPPTAYTLAFGHGLHRCLGARLAELEAVTVVEQAARALPDVVPSGPEPPWTRLLSFQSPDQVLVERAAGQR